MKNIFYVVIIISGLFACKSTKQASTPPTPPQVVVAEKVVEKTPDEWKVVSIIFQKNQNVEISRCWKSGKKYFRAQMNVYDGSGKIYDETGKQVASCTPMLHTDPLCSMDKYEVIYTPTKNIWGHKAIDVLGLAH